MTSQTPSSSAVGTIASRIGPEEARRSVARSVSWRATPRPRAITGASSASSRNCATNSHAVGDPRNGEPHSSKSASTTSDTAVAAQPSASSRQTRWIETGPGSGPTVDRNRATASTPIIRIIAGVPMIAASLPKSWFGPSSTCVTTIGGSTAPRATASRKACACHVCARKAVIAIVAASSVTTIQAVGR